MLKDDSMNEKTEEEGEFSRGIIGGEVCQVSRGENDHRFHARRGGGESR